MNLEKDIEPKLKSKVGFRYWNANDDHASFRSIIDALSKAGLNADQVVNVLHNLDDANFTIKR